MTFETTFFGPGNRLRWEAIQAGSLADDVKTRLAPFIEDLRRNPEVLILPRVRDDGRIQWYVMCSSSRAARVARDEVRAFLGPTYSDFEGRPTHLDSADGVEAAVLARSGSNAFRLEVPDGALVNAARGRLRLLMRLRDERPARHGRRMRVTGRILRDFEYALLARDGTAASDCIAELRSDGHLGATNLLFLEVRRLEATGQWREILALPELEALAAMPRPRRVTVALIRAVYEGLLREFEEGTRSAEAIEVFRSAVLPRFRNLYRSRAGLFGYEIDASFLMVAAASPVPRPDLASAMLAAYGPESAGRAYLVALADLIPGAVTRPEEKTLSEARAAFATADIDRAYELALSLSPSFDRCALLLRCARDMGTLAAAQVALAAVEALALSDRSRLDEHAVLGRIRDGLAALATETATAPSPAFGVGEEIPSSWSVWLRRLTLQTPWSAAVSVAEAAAREWSFEAVATDAAAVEATANLLLSDRPEWGQSALRDALPHLLEFFLSRGPDPRLRVVYDAFFLVLAVDEQVSLPQVAALLRATEARIQIGVGTGEYRDILRELSSAIDAVESPTVANLALEALDTLVGVACPDPRQRQEFLVRVGALFQRWYRRIDQAQWVLLRRYGEELGVSDVIQAGGPEEQEGVPPAQSVWDALDGKRIALYSLREAALRRVESVVRELCPAARIETFHDSVGGSPALRAASATADVFVLATAAAKHAATIFIEANRPKARVTIYARGQGSASLLDAIREYLVNSTGSGLAARGSA